MAEIELRHIALGRTIRVPRRAARVWRRRGWQDVTETVADPVSKVEPEPATETFGLEPDEDASDEAKENEEGLDA